MSAQRLEVIGQRRARSAKPARQLVDLAHAAHHASLGVVERALLDAEADRRARFLTMPEAADYLCYRGQKGGQDPANSAYAFLRTHGVHLQRRGTVVLVRVGDIDHLLETGESDLVARARAMGARRG